MEPSQGHLTEPNTMLFFPIIAPLFTATPSTISEGAVVPQPEVPICSRCTLGKPPKFASGEDATLSVLIDKRSLADVICDMTLTTYDAIGDETVTVFSDDVIDEINKSDWTTAISVDTPDAQRAVLTFELSDGSLVDEFIPVYSR
ncbi:MAG: hypothetical protein AAFV53_10165 [Myxococcota bacterium]